MAIGEGPGWHRESRRHSEIQVDRRPTHGRVLVHRPHLTNERPPRDSVVLARGIIDEEIQEYRRAMDREFNTLLWADLFEYENGLQEADSDIHFALINSKNDGEVRSAVRKGYRDAMKAHKERRTLKRQAKLWAWEQTFEAVF